MKTIGLVFFGILAAYVGCSNLFKLERFVLPGTDTSIAFEIECTEPFRCESAQQTLIVWHPNHEPRRVCLNTAFDVYRIQIYKLKDPGNFLIVGYADLAAISVHPFAIKDTSGVATDKYPSKSSCGNVRDIRVETQLQKMDQGQREYIGAFDSRNGSWVFMSPSESPEQKMEELGPKGG